MAVDPSLDNWVEFTDSPDIGQQFKQAFFDKGNQLLLPKHLYEKQYKDRTDVLHHVAFNHPKPIVRTKACIIMSRISSGLDLDQAQQFKNNQTKMHKWTIDVLRQLIARDWDDISINITPRWCIAILNCFAENGTAHERVVANSITMMYYMLLYGPNNTTGYRADDTFINSMLRINQSLTDEIRLVLLTTLRVININGFANIATVWRLILGEKLTDKEQVQEELTTTDQVQAYMKLHFPDMDVRQNKSYGEQ